MSVAEVQEDLLARRRRFRDFRYHHRLLKIVDFQSGIPVPWVLNPIQKLIRAEIVRQEQEGLPVRIIGVKSRRTGFSTTIQGTNFGRAWTKRHYTAITIANEADNAGYLHTMSEVMHDNLPSKLRPAVASFRKGKLLELTNGSKLRTDTANDKNAGRGSGVRAIHASEYAHWENQAEVMRSIRQTVPLLPGTLVCVESTANGIGDGFHAMYRRAKEGRSRYVPLFFAWHHDLNNWIAPPPDFELADEEEEGLRSVFGLSDGQLWWRRLKIQDDFDEDTESFHQEYPSDDNEAFLASGNSYFTNTYGLKPVTPRYTGELEGDWRSALRFVPALKGALVIWEVPKEEERYLIALDPAGSITERQQKTFHDRREATDWNVAYVVRLSDGAMVARWRWRGDVDVAAYEAAKIARIYNFPPFIVDVTGGYGATVIHVLRTIGYPAIWRDRARDRYTQERSSKYGFLFNAMNREFALARLKRIVRTAPWLVPDAQAIDEMAAFIINSRGKPEAGPNMHDDCVLCLAMLHAVLPEYIRDGAALPS